MSTVYEVLDAESGASLAAKVLHQRGSGVARFGREYRALTRLDHPNVLKVYRYGLTADGSPYLVMELVHGVPAQVRVKSVGRPGEPPRTAEAARIGSQIADALAHLHARGIVHRDLKSSNVMVLGNGEVKLIDFGTARLLWSPEEITRRGEFVGTFAYASPEQLTGGEVDARSDLYALGVLLYRMLSGKRPFDADDPQELARMHLERTPTPPHVVAPGVPEALSELAMSLMAKNPRDRPGSAREVAHSLRAFAPGGPGHRVRTSLRPIGRQPQVDAIQAVLDHGAAGAALLFTGPEGSGRGRLVDVAMEEAQQRGARTILAERGDVAAILENLRRAWSELDDPAVLQAVDHAAGRADVASLTDALARRAAADGAPVVIGAPGLDEAALADRERLLAAMARAQELAVPVQLFGTWAEELPPPTWPGAGVLAVPPLTATEVATLAGHWLGVATVPPELVRRLLAASGGMPRPLEELVRALPRSGSGPELIVPATVKDALMIRLECLSRLERRVAETVALAEGELDVPRIAWAVDETVEEATAALSALEDDRLLVRRGQRWSFRMGMAGDLVRSRTRNTRRNLLCRRLAGKVLDLPPSERVATVLLDSGRAAEAAPVAVEWGWRLARAGLHAEALPVLDRIAAAPGAAGFGSLWALYAECLAEIRPNAIEADRALGRAGALATGDRDRARIELAAARLARARGETKAERGLLLQAANRLEASEAWEEAAIANERLAELLLQLGELGEADQRAQSARGFGERTDSFAAVTLAMIRTERGELESAETLARAVVNAAQARGLPYWRAASALGAVLRVHGRLSEARSILDDALSQARTQAPARRLARLLLVAAEIDLEFFRVGQARERLAQARDALGGEFSPRLDGPAALVEARLRHLAADDVGALPALEQALQRASDRGLSRVVAELQGARGILLHRAGRRPEGEAQYEAARAALRGMGAVRALARLAVERAVILRGAQDPDVLFADVKDWILSERPGVFLVEYRLAALRHARHEGRDMGETRRAAVAAIQSVRAALSPEDAASIDVHPWSQAVAMSVSS
jgi:tetratricopeptide (TPR) repeat protein